MSTDTRSTARGGIAVPARFRGQLADGAVVARWLDSCLAIFPMTAWDELAAKVGSLPMTDPNARLLQRQLFAGALETELDAAGSRPRPAGPARPSPASRPRRWCSGPATTRRSGRPARWNDYSRSLDDPDAFAQRDRRAGDLTSHHMRFQGPLGIRNRLVEERWS